MSRNVSFPSPTPRQRDAKLGHHITKCYFVLALGKERHLVTHETKRYYLQARLYPGAQRAAGGGHLPALSVALLCLGCTSCSLHAEASREQCWRPQASNPRCRGASASQGPPKSQDSCCLATLVMCTAPTFPWWFLTSHTWDSQPSWSPGTVSAPGPTGVKGGWFPKEKQELLPPKKALGLGNERPWACSGVYVFPGAQSRAHERKRRWKRAGCPLSFPEGQPPALACFPKGHFPLDLGGWVQVPLPSLLPLPSLSHFLGSKRAISSSSCAPHTEHTAGATVCFGLRSAQSSSFPRLIGALPRCTIRQVSPLYSSSRDSGESQKDTVGWGPAHTPHPP